MAGTLEAIALVRAELEPRDDPGDRLRGRALHARELRDRGRLVERLLADEGVHALRARRVEAAARASSSPCRPTTCSPRLRAGAQALQVFDSWVGRALGREDYLRYVAPHNRDALRRGRARQACR